MNRKQRRARQRSDYHLGTIALKDITWPWEMTNAECETMLANRLVMNLHQTGHPFHHLTANGVVVDADPTLEYYMSRLAPENQEHIRRGWIQRVAPDARKTIPVNRKFYGSDPYEGKYSVENRVE